MSKTAREVIENCHRDWRGFWPRGFAEDLEKRLKAQGFAIVPVEPTEKMLLVAFESPPINKWDWFMTDGDRQYLRGVYKSMLSATEEQQT